MRPEFVVVAGVGRKDPAQMGFAEDNDVIEALPTDRAGFGAEAGSDFNRAAAMYWRSKPDHDGQVAPMPAVLFAQKKKCYF
jgi:hypothetical protein